MSLVQKQNNLITILYVGLSFHTYFLSISKTTASCGGAYKVTLHYTHANAVKPSYGRLNLAMVVPTKLHFQLHTGFIMRLHMTIVVPVNYNT